MPNETISSANRGRQLKVSRYDRISSGLWAMIVVFGVLALFVGLVFLQFVRFDRAENQFPDQELNSARYIALEPLADVDKSPEGVEFSDCDEPKLVEIAEAFTDEATRLQGWIYASTGNDVVMVPGKTGPGMKHKFPAATRPADRWSIEYESENIKKYLEQLSSFGIEIGFVSKRLDQVEIVYNINTSPKIRPSTKAEERRVYFIHANSKLRSWDRQVAMSAGIAPNGKIMVQFYPSETANALAQLEAAEAQRLGIEFDQIYRTTFKVRDAGESYEYYVAEILRK